MLSEEQLELMQERISNRFVKVNDEVLEVIGTRIAEIGKVKNSDVYKLKRLLANGTDVRDVELRLAQATQKSLKDMEYILERVAKENYEFSEAFYKAKGLEFVSFKDNVAINKKWQALYKQSSKELVNITKNTAFMAMVDGEKVPTLFQTLYNNVIDKAVIEASSGLVDYQSAMRKTIRDVADSGLRSVDYATGYSRRLDTAVRQNVLWALKECNQQVADMTGDEFGADGFEVSYHSNPRPSHVAMGGRMFSDKGDKRLNGKLYPDGTVVKELLGDYGCLHFAFSVLLGVSEPTLEQEELTSLKAEDAKKIEFEGVKMTKYEASQKQRQIETKVRHLKDRANIAKASGDDELRRETQSKINLLTSKYAKLSREANLPTKMERMGVRGFRAVKPSNKLSESINEKGINKINDGKYNTIVNLKYINSKEYRDKFNTITDNKNVNNSIHRYSKAILTHRTGTDFEDLYIVDANTGKFVAKETSAKVKHEVQYSKKVEAIVKKNPNKLISLHNHSSNNPPTGSDLVSNGNRKYIKGVVACHNGEVFVYSVGDKVFSRTFFDLNVDKFRKRGYNDIKAHEETLDLFKKEFGIDWRRL